MKHIFLLFVGLCLCATSVQALTVAASFPPVHSLVAAVMKDVDMPTLINRKQSQSHHGYELSTSEAKSLQKADVIFWIGPQLETYMPDALQNIASYQVTSVPLMLETPNLKILPASGKAKGDDVHIWMNPDNAVKMVEKIRDVLIEKDSKNKKRYEENTNRFISTINRLSDYQVKTTTGVQPVVVSLHDGFQYMFDYMKLQKSISLNADEDYLKGPKSIQATKNEIAALNPVCLILDPGTKRSTVRMLTDDKYKTVYMDTMGWYLKSNPSHYMKMMTRGMENINQCLGLKK